MLPLLRCAVWALAWACALAPLPGAAQGRARIVTLTPSLTEAVCALGQCEQLVATDRHSAWPALLPAVRQQQVCQLDDERMGLLLRPGHRMGEAAQMLVDCLRALPPASP